MRVAYYNHTSTVSGAEISLLLTARNMTMVEPVIFTPEGELLDRAVECGIPTVRINGYRARLSKNPLRIIRDICGMLWTGFKVAQAVRVHNIDVIHANSLRAGIMAALFAWLHHRPLVWHVRDIPPDGVIGKAINQLAAFAADGIICISKPVLEGFDKEKLKGRLHLIHNGVELQEISELEKQRIKKRTRKQLNTPLQSKVMVIIGQITPWKRQRDAILATKQLIKEGHDVCLWVVGEAKFRPENFVYKESLHELAAELNLEGRVRFTGFRKDVLEICCGADLLLLCSDNEPFGRVIIEAMSQSVPVIASNAGGVPEIIEQDHCGLMYEVADIEGLVRCAKKLLTNDSLRQRMGGFAVKRVKEHFTIQSTVAKVEDVYRTVLSQKAISGSQYAKEKEFS